MIKALGKLAIAAVLIFVLLQFIRPAIPTQPATAEELAEAGLLPVTA